MVVALAAAAACGEGKAIFNIDVFSFMQASDVDTIPYYAPVPPGTPDTIPVQEVQLLPIGMDQSIVDTARVRATIDFVNSSGTGQVGFAIYIDSVPNVYAGTPAFTVGPVAVSGTNTSQGVIDTDLVSTLLPLFARSSVWIGARVTATASVPPVQGVARVSSLDLRIVLQERVF
jgi:hypothetical protein